MAAVVFVLIIVARSLHGLPEDIDHQRDRSRGRKDGAATLLPRLARYGRRALLGGVEAILGRGADRTGPNLLEAGRVPRVFLGGSRTSRCRHTRRFARSGRFPATSGEDQCAGQQGVDSALITRLVEPTVGEGQASAG